MSASDEDRDRVIRKRADLFLEQAASGDFLDAANQMAIFDAEHRVTRKEADQSRIEAVLLAATGHGPDPKPIPRTYVNFTYEHRGCCPREGEQITIGAPIIDGTYMREVVRCAANHAELALVEIDGEPVQ